MIRRISRRYRRYLFLFGCVYFMTSFWMVLNLDDGDENQNGLSASKWSLFTRISDPFGSRQRRYLDLRNIQIKGIQPEVTPRSYDYNPTWERCYNFTPNSRADIMMEEIWDRVSVGYPKLVLSVTGWVDTIKVTSWSVKPLHVIVVPHSHQDPGWLQTANNYFTIHTKRTLDLIVKILVENPKWTFIWSETVFLNWWWTTATPEQRDDLKTLLQTRQLEMVTGGWVMPDEATTHYHALIEQLIEGHQWIKNMFNLSVTSSWAIDPFGHSSTMPYLFKRAGIQNMVIQRTHFAIKRLFASERNLEFKWKQQWEGRNEGILCHMMPFLLYSIPHSCGPDRHVCCKFDFQKGNCFHGNKRSETVQVTDENVADLSRELWEQLQKKSELYRSHVVLLPHGDDFRYDTEAEWNKQFMNMEKLMKYLNSNEEFKMKMEFGTISDYFLALRSEQSSDLIEKHVPSLAGDFLTYSDRGDQYWSGIFTTRPHLKILIRQLQYQLRLAEFMFLFSHYKSSLTYHTYSRMETIRRTMAIHLHHDAITGTSRKHVIKDYIDKLNSSIAEAKRFISKSLKQLIMKSCSEKSNLDEELFQTLNNQQNLSKKQTEEVHIFVPPLSNITVMVTNILGQKRVEVVHVTVNTSRVCLKDINSIPVRYQISPVWKLDGTIITDKYRVTSIPLRKALTHNVNLMSTILVCDDFCIIEAEKEKLVFGSSKSTIMVLNFLQGWELSFEVDIEPFTVKPYVIKHEADVDHSMFVSNLKYYNQNINRSRLKDDIFEISYSNEDVIKLTNHHLSAIITTQDGLLKYVYHHNKATLYRSDTHFVMYSTGRNSHPFSDKSGAYIFLPDGVAKEFTANPVSILEINGPVFSQVRTKYQSITNVVTIFNISGPQAHGVQVENIVDISNDDWNNRELAMRIETDLFNDDHTICTDVNGFQLQRRKTRAKMTLQGNFHPVTTMALTENNDSRFTLLTTNVHGVASLVSGWLEAMLNRRLIQDDWRGLNEIITDNVPVSNTFFLLFEERVGNSEKAGRKNLYCLPSSVADTLSEELNNPLAISDLAHSFTDACTSKMVQAKGLPCGYCIINFRVRFNTEDKKEALVVIHHRATDCGFTTNVDCKRKVSWSFKDISSLVITEVQETSLTGTEVKRLLKLDEPIRINPMEIKTYKIAFR